jgi:hypothetical protein
MPTPEDQKILDAIRSVGRDLGHAPSKAEFKAKSGITEFRILKHFPSWREAVRGAGLTPDSTNVKLDDEVLLEDWGELVRRARRIPTRDQYRREGKYSPGVFERHFGPWSSIPTKFQEYARKKPQWADVLPLLPLSTQSRQVASASTTPHNTGAASSTLPVPQRHHAKVSGRATYGNPIDFRGLRHQPVNEQGVVFLFGMVAKELGYMVEALQAGFPDCEAKRQVGPNEWQRVRIEFEFESRSFRDHGHPNDGCDIIICWRHNWPECPQDIEVVALESVIQSLAKTDD